MILENFCICMRKCNFVCTQSMPIRFIAYVALDGLCAIACVFMCRSIHSIPKCFVYALWANILLNKCHFSLSLSSPPFAIDLALWMIVRLIYLVPQPHTLHKETKIWFSTHRPNQLVKNWTSEARARVGVPYIFLCHSGCNMYFSICKSDLWSMCFTSLSQAIGKQTAEKKINNKTR